MEMLDDFGIDKIMEIINDSGIITEGLSRPVFIVLSKPGANECPLHQTV